MTAMYYKATRPNGTDFYSGTVDYAAALTSGKPIRVRTKAADVYVCCTSDVLHASDIPTETLISGSWPCRLFVVTGNPKASEGHKYGFRSLRVVEEIDAWRALGPQGEHVAALIEAARNLPPDQAQAAWAAAYAAAWEASRDAAWDAARYAARYAAWNAAWNAARNAAWNAAWDAARNAAWNAARNAAWDAAWDAARNAAWDAARDAAGGLIVRDLISTEHYDALTLPWRNTIGRIHPDDPS